MAFLAGFQPVLTLVLLLLLLLLLIIVTIVSSHHQCYLGGSSQDEDTIDRFKSGTQKKKIKGAKPTLSWEPGHLAMALLTPGHS